MSRGIPAKGAFLGETVETTVDSEAARYYLESYLQGQDRDPGMHARIEAVYRQQGNAIPSRDDLARISSDMSVDFAALFLADRLSGNECNRELRQSFARFLRDERSVAADMSPYFVLFVPGWDYAANGDVTGADFAQPRKLATGLGLGNALVELPPTGSVEENSRVLAAEISRRTASGKKLLLAGASSAGPAIHLALAELLSQQELGSIKAWLNLGGILQGSPLIDYYQSKPQVLLFDLVVWSKGWNPDSLLSMGTGPGRERFRRLHIKADILIVNYLGVPLSGQLSQYSSDKYPLLSSGGPNDGLTLLADAIAPDSLTIVALGTDHFFAEDPRINEKTIALMKLIVTTLEGNQTLGCR